MTEIRGLSPHRLSLSSQTLVLHTILGEESFQHFLCSAKETCNFVDPNKRSHPTPYKYMTGNRIKIWIYTNICLYMNMYIYVCVYVYAVLSCVWIPTATFFSPVSMCICVWIYIYVDIHMYVHMFTNTRANIHTYKYKRAYTSTRLWCVISAYIYM